MAFQVSQFPQGGGLNIGRDIQQGLQIRESRRESAKASEADVLPLLMEGAKRLNILPTPESKISLLKTMRGNFGRAGLPTEVLEQGIIQLESGDLEGFQAATDQLLQFGKEARFGRASPKASAPQTIRKQIGEDEEGNPKFGLFTRQLVFDPTKNESRVIETPIEGDLVTSTGETIGQQRTEDVRARGLEEQAKVEGKAKGEAGTVTLVSDTKAQIATAVKLAEKAAIARGDTLTDLKRSEAALPGLRDVVSKLKDVALIATSTLSGRAFDFVVKESGFGSTKGANARAKFISIVNNQVLPLLKQTFGAAFTEREGETLKATMGDPNATPEQKITQLNAFIDQKVRDIQGKQREVGAEVGLTEELTTGRAIFSTSLNREITEADISDTLAANPDLTREQLLQKLQVQ
ncbi:MAG: hypothetical protein JKY86_15430 [Gammaproteobacteria bacterium]|nr:hypothetical protein [Gammaproteobacteria bacterium]